MNRRMLFVYSENIDRSPTAEDMLKSLLNLKLDRWTTKKLLEE
jgi:protein-tyrosine-phosphatase